MGIDGPGKELEGWIEDPGLWREDGLTVKTALPETSVHRERVLWTPCMLALKEVLHLFLWVAVFSTVWRLVFVCIFTSMGNERNGYLEELIRKQAGGSGLFMAAICIRMAIASIRT